MSKTMRAAVFADFGGPEVVEVRKVPMPEPGPGQVRIKVEAATTCLHKQICPACDRTRSFTVLF